MKIYISGKITNNQNYKEQFKNAVYFIIEQKEKLFPNENEITYFNPAEVKLPDTATWEDYMRYDLKVLLECQAIFMLDGWKESEGAKTEHYLAEKLNDENYLSKIKSRSELIGLMFYGEKT